MVVFIITIGNYFRLSDTQSIRPVIVVSLMICGIALGVIIANVGFYLKSRKDE